MPETMTTVLVVGATGSIGQHVTAQALAAGFQTRALVRNAARDAEAVDYRSRRRN